MVTHGPHDVMIENLDPNTQYRKIYKGLSLIRHNLDTTHKMATRSSWAPHIVIQQAQRDTVRTRGPWDLPFMQI
jgi:hypothetical protein